MDRIERHRKAIVKLFESRRYGCDVHTFFSDFCEMSAIAISNSVDLAQFDARENRYLEIARRYDPETMQIFPKILGEVTMALEAEPCDILGAVFHDLELHTRQAGQFFTPYHLCRLAAGIQAPSGDELHDLLSSRGHITVHEPAVGAGAMVIAFAEEVKSRLKADGYEPLRLPGRLPLHVTAVDIDRRAVHMSYIQLSLLDIPATIIRGDTLRMELDETWHTPAHILGGWSRRLSEDRIHRNEAKDLPDETPAPC